MTDPNKPFFFRLVEGKTFQELGRGKMHSTPLRKVSTTRRNGVTVTKLKKTTEHETRIFELRTTAKDRAVVYIGGNEATCERVRPEQPWHETFTELLERHRSPLSQPQPGNGAWECERKTWRVCEALISTAPAIARIWECEPNIWRECEAGTPCYDDVTPERTNTVFRIVDGWRHEQPGPGTVIFAVRGEYPPRPWCEDRALGPQRGGTRTPRKVKQRNFSLQELSI